MDAEETYRNLQSEYNFYSGNEDEAKRIAKSVQASLNNMPIEESDKLIQIIKLRAPFLISYEIGHYLASMEKQPIQINLEGLIINTSSHNPNWN